MIKRTLSRNARSRGFKVKHVLQICLLLGVCFWLIYQVKHSHDKKEELDKKDAAKVSVKSQNGNGDADLGRKGLIARVQDEKHEEDDEDEAMAEEEEKKVQDEHKHEGEEREDEAAKNEEDAKEEESKNEEDAKEEEESRNEEDAKEEESNRDEEEREDGHKHEDAEEVSDEENKREVKDGGSNREEEEDEREEGNRQEEEGHEEGNKHEEENAEEGNKHDDEEQEEETKNDETEEDGRGGGDDEIDERDQQKIEGEADHEEDLVDEEKEREEIVEKEGETDKEGQVDHEASVEDQDHDGGAQNHEAREKHYTEDDASSAVTHDTEIVSNKQEKISSDSSNDNSVANNIELDKNSIDNKDIIEDPKNSTSQSGGVKTDGENDDKTTKSEEQLPKSAANEQQLPVDKPAEDVNTEAEKNLASESTEFSGTAEQKEIPVTYDSNNPQNETVNATDNVEASNLKTTELVSDDRELNSTSTASDKTENTDTVANSEPDSSNTTTKPEVSAELEVKSGSSTVITESEDAAQDENSGTKNESSGTDENPDLSSTDGTGDAVHDPIDSTDNSISQDEKEARIDLDTLPENIAEGINSRDAAAE
ncbi:uncharacterized protein [Euphorbia lathyris]|uniref:uncharacterized protein n=1 Tax=Euphorbia lathyris TaxID=212925 RepID=UPI00331318DD